MPNLIVLSGMPGSGKTTWAKELFDLKYTILSPDTFIEAKYGSFNAVGEPADEASSFAWSETYSRLEGALSHNIDCIVDATNLWRSSRQRLLEIGWRNQSRCHLVIFKNMVDAIDRNAARHSRRVNTAGMEAMTDRYYDTLSEVENESWDSITMLESFR